MGKSHFRDGRMKSGILTLVPALVPAFVPALPALLLLLAPFSAPAQDDQTDWAQLAAHWAPLINQSTRHEFRTDVITAFDFDGDWNAANNQLPRQGIGMPSRVYYWGSETATHYYIGYAFYHILDVPGFDTEEAKSYAHDMQGIVVAVEKSDDQPMGRFVALTTWGDDQRVFYTEHDAYEGELSEAWQHNVAFSDDPPEGSGDIDFMVDSNGFHPVVYAEAGHHSVYGELAQTAFPEGPAMYELKKVTELGGGMADPDMNQRSTGGRAHRPGNRGVSATAEGLVPKDDGLIYRYEGYPQEIIGERTRGRGTVLHHWNLTGYDLRPLSEFWDRRKDYEADAEEKVFAAAGVFAAGGELKTGSASRAPWVWGELFFDPGAYFADLTGTGDGEAASTITATSFAGTEEFAGEHATYKEAAQ